MIEFLSQNKLMLSAPSGVKSIYICSLNMNADYRRADHITESNISLQEMELGTWETFFFASLADTSALYLI